MVEAKTSAAGGQDAAERPPQDDQLEASNLESEATDATAFSLKVLPLTFSLHQKHGLRHNDYQRYRGYCSRRLARVRKATKMVQGEKKRFHKKEVTGESLREEKLLEIPLMTTERAWAYAMQLKFEMNTEPRKRFHMINRMRKAVKEAEKLERLVMENNQCDARTKLEVQAYHLWLSGTLFFELQEWATAAKALTAAKTIYERLAGTLNEDEAAVYRQRMQEIVPSLRFCAYNISGDEAARQDLMHMRGGGEDVVDELLSQAREEQAATLQEVEWRGRKMAVRQEKVRVFLLRQQEFREELDNAEGHEARLEAFESLLMDCKDALQALRDELFEDPTFRNRQQAREGPVTTAHFLYTYLSFLKCTRTVDRNLEMATKMKENLERLGENEENDNPRGASAKKQQQRPTRPQDLVRLYEAVIANLGEMPTLAGLEEDLKFAQEVQAKVVFFRAWRCLYIAQAFLAVQKWPEAMALFHRALTHARKAQQDPLLPEDLRVQIDGLVASVESKQFMAHANSILEAEKSKNSTPEEKEKQVKDAKKMLPLMERLDEYYEDPDLAAGKVTTPLAAFPPAFVPLPCKPLFFDLAREQVAFPNLEHKLGGPAGGKDGGGQASGGGWLGGWLGGWSKK